MAVEPPTPLHRFSLEEYHRLIEAGGFDEDARIELIDGLLVDMSAKTAPHDAGRVVVQGSPRDGAYEHTEIVGAGGELVASRLELPPISVAELLAAAG